MRRGGSPSAGIPPSSSLLPAALLLLCLLPLRGGGAQVSLEEADRIAREVHARGKYPSSLDLGGRKEPPLWKRPAGTLPREGRKTRVRRKPSASQGITISLRETPWGAILAALLAGILAVALGAVLFLDQGGGSRRAGRVTGPGGGNGGGSPAGGGRGPSPPADPEELARQGRFDEALRALLLRALGKAGWAPKGGDRSLTAREILAALPAEDPRRIPLGRILAAEEAVRFAGRPATEELFREALESFRSLGGLEGSGMEEG